MTLVMEPESLVPYDYNAERKLIGSLIIEPKEIPDVMINTHPDFFHTTTCKWMYEAICKLHIEGNPITPDTISSYLKTGKELDGRTKFEAIGAGSGILAFLEGLSGGEVQFWTTQVRRKYDERRLLEFANEARKLALSNPDDVGKIRSKLEERLVSLSGETHNSSVAISVAVTELDARIARYIDRPDDIIGLRTTYRRLDEAIDGLQPGNVSIVYAPSSRFKSLFTTNIGWHLAEQDIPGLWFTTEMPRIQVMERLLQLESGLNLKWLRRDKRVYEFKGQITTAQRALGCYPIFFCDTSALDVAEIRSEVNRHSRWNDIKYIIIDLVDHVSSSRFRDEMINNQRAVMSAMKQIAKDFDIHVLLVSHVSKGNEQTRRQADLDVENMIGSSAKYQDVDASISLAPVKIDDGGRWIAMEREDILFNVSNSGKLDVMVSITKNRHGELLRYITTIDFNQGGRIIDEEWIRPRETQKSFIDDET